MKTDFKISRLTQYDNGMCTVVARFYEGEVTTEDELVGREMKPVTRYRRTQMIREVTYELPAEDVRRTLKAELKADRIRTPIPEQDD